MLETVFPFFLLIFYFSALSLPFSLLTFHPDFDLFGQSLLFSINLQEWFFGNSDMPNLRPAHRNFGGVVLDNCWARFKVKIKFFHTGSEGFKIQESPT